MQAQSLEYIEKMLRRGQDVKKKYLYKRGIEKNEMGYACAVGVVLLVIALAINVAQLFATGTFKIRRKGED